MRIRSILVSVLIVSAVWAVGAQDARDEEFVGALMARGYYDLLELQYEDWLKQPGLKPEQVAALKHGLIRVYTEWAEVAASRMSSIFLLMVAFFST